MNDVALSKNGARVLRGFFALVVVFLYAPIVILLIFSFNNSDIPAFPCLLYTSDAAALDPGRDRGVLLRLRADTR